MENMPENMVDSKIRKNDILFLKISYLCIILFPIATLIFALIKSGDYKKDPVLSSHLSWQLGTIIRGFLYAIALVLTVILLAFFIPVLITVLSIILYLLLLVWVLYRVIKGFMLVSNDQVIS